MYSILPLITPLKLVVRITTDDSRCDVEIRSTAPVRADDFDGNGRYEKHLRSI